MKPPQRTWTPFTAAAQYQAGLTAFEQGRYAEAIESLSRIAPRSLPGTLARFYLGQARYRLGLAELRAERFGSAAENFAAARRINPDSAGLSRYLTAAYIGQRRFDLAADEIERERKSGATRDNHGDPTIRLAYALVRDGQLERAVTTLEDGIRAAPWRADLHQQLGLILASADECDSALRSLKRAAELAPLNAEILMNLALAFGAVQRPAEAIAPLTLCHRLRPNDAHVAYLLAVARDAAGPTATADERPNADRTIAARSPLLESSGTPGFAESNGTRPDDDIDALSDLIVAQPDFVEAFLRLPESPIDADVFAMLARTLEAALERRPDYADLHHHCSRVYDRLGRVDDAVDAARRAVQANPRYVQALIQLGELYARTNRNDEAVERLRAAIEAGGDFPDVYFMLGRLYRDRGDRDAALSAYRRALELNSDYGAAQQAVRELTAV